MLSVELFVIQKVSYKNNIENKYLLAFPIINVRTIIDKKDN